MTDNIVLIGFMGVGKGRTARTLAELTGRFAIDTDDMIESMVKMKIRKIFAKQGEASFRQLEQRAADWLETRVTGTVVSTGGGFFMVNNIRRTGRVIYLHSTVESIISAIKNHPKAEKKIKKRPLLQDLGKAKELYAQRLPLYREAADHEIVVEGREIHEVAQEIIGLTGV
ncbi:MAG: shikimate kinase [Desulfobacterales bacterium]|nr:shikimate kinase [Desulfobacterales bacterium]